jgi:hypothetical protein
MSAHDARVFRLDIIYPEGSREPGWRPYGWDSYLRSLPALKRRRLRKAGFSWPRERMFLSSSSAYERACLLQAFGADVQVLRSDPVTWPAHWTWEDEAGRHDAATAWLAERYDASGLPLAPEEPTAADEVRASFARFTQHFEEAGL